MGFSNPIIGGISNLIRAAIRSPNFVTGLTGWSINRDGTAEFNNAIIRGLLQAGSIIAGSISQATIGSSILVGDQLFDCDYIIDDSGGTILIYSLAGQTVVGISATGDGTFNVPAGVTTLKVECWGAGGGGNGSYAAPGSNIVGGGGGSGAEYAAEPNYPVTPLAALNYHVGVGGAGGTGRTALPQTPIIGGVGENTTFDLAGVGVTAHGAGGGMLGAVPGGTGSTNTVHFDGGAKAGGSAFNSGAGGEAPEVRAESGITANMLLAIRFPALVGQASPMPGLGDPVADKTRSAWWGVLPVAVAAAAAVSRVPARRTVGVGLGGKFGYPTARVFSSRLSRGLPVRTSTGTPTRPVSISADLSPGGMLSPVYNWRRNIIGPQHKTFSTTR